jgi:hypothetical protein
MTADDLRAIMAYLRDKVQLDTSEPIKLKFQSPSENEMIQDGLPPEGTRQILSAEWWEDMIIDIIETPDFCEPDESPEQILAYAKDVVSDYLRKRVKL